MTDHQKPGVGLPNVKARLAELYGSQGRLVIKENQPHGVTKTGHNDRLVWVTPLFQHFR